MVAVDCIDYCLHTGIVCNLNFGKMVDKDHSSCRILCLDCPWSMASNGNEYLFVHYLR
jgi:hypothetical protein